MSLLKVFWPLFQLPELWPERFSSVNSHLDLIYTSVFSYAEGRRQIFWLLVFLSGSRPSGLKETLNHVRFQTRDNREMKSDENPKVKITDEFNSHFNPSNLLENCCVRL